MYYINDNTNYIVLHNYIGDEEMCENKTAPYFPLFVNLTGKRVTVVGGGDTACRKIRMLLKFGVNVYVISPEISPEIGEMVRGNIVRWLKSSFSPGLLEGTDLLVAATNIRAVNHKVYEAAKQQRILVNICDSREESSFIFPTIAQNDSIIAGVVTVDDDFISAKNLVKKIREKFGALH